MKLGRPMPPELQALHALEVDYDDGEGMDFEPYPAFFSEEETEDWIRAWTGNDTLDGAEYRIFGQDGTGGYAAFWLISPEKPILEQPIVFFGSEGAVGVVASNFSDYLWLLAGGVGPYEAIELPGIERSANPQFTAFAKRHAGTPYLDPWEVVTKAQAAFTGFAERIDQLCR